MRINAETMQAKERRLEEERQADMRDMEYLKNKMVRKQAALKKQKTESLCNSGTKNNSNISVIYYL